MLTAEENERLCRVGPGTPMGELMRRYWHPIAPTAALRENPVRPVRILGEDLVLYQDRTGGLGLIGPRCAHRATGMQFGIPEAEGLRCPYHGWLYDGAGRCLETPLEPADSTFKDRVTIPAYPVQELGGLIFAYLGPPPAPRLPRWDLFVWPNAVRQIGVCVLDCNWLQCQENALDLQHNTYLHGHFFKYVLERMGVLEERAPDKAVHRAFTAMNNRLASLEHEVTEYGIQKFWRREGDPAARLNRGPFVLFPYATRPGGGVRSEFQIRVPQDDTHTYHINYQVYAAPPGIEAPAQAYVPYYDVPLQDEQGRPILDYVLAQDMYAWQSQGAITDRTQERLATTDRGIILFRQLLQQQLQIVEDGGRPMNVFPDTPGIPAPGCIHLDPPVGDDEFSLSRLTGNYRSLFHQGYDQDDVDRYGPATDLVKELIRRIEAAAPPR